jgi:acetoin utilization protein AcuB
MLVDEIAQTDLITVTPEASLATILHLLNRKGVRHLLVVQYGRLVGIISDRDVKSVLALSSGIEGLDHYRTAEQIMTRDPIAIAPTAPIEEAARLMMSARISALPMVQDTRLIGIVTETDLLRILSDVMRTVDPMGGSNDKTRISPVKQKQP